MAEPEAHLDFLAMIMGIHGHDFKEVDHFETGEEVKPLIPGSTFRYCVTYGDPGDPIFVVMEQGEVKLTGYVSFRGHLYQAGAFDGLFQFASSNTGYHGPQGQWETRENVCGEIAERAWEALEKE
jgi:hypothetical protein